MKANVGGMDRVIRAILGIVLLALGIWVFHNVLQWVAIVIGAILLITALVSFCPIWSLLKINTAKKEAEGKAATT
ncbi:MAG: DUF2892 domain-containing protein [candidate division KSB1 bacterium]|nr:DUF2892 domain-containing protein [candidate division KSB1 bacterium]